MATTPVMSSAEIVTDQFVRSRQYADNLEVKVSGMLDALAAAPVVVPLIDVSFDTSIIDAPSIPDVGPVPTMTVHTPQAVPLPSEEVTGLDDVVLNLPEFTAVPPVLNFGNAPETTIGTVPTLPGIRDVTLPDAPEVELPTLPTMLALNTPTFAGMGSHADWLERLKNAPTLDLVRPTPLVYRRGQAYESMLLDNLKAVLNERIKGGTGLSAEVEALIWGRAVDRESRLALDAELDIVRSGEALGFKLPQGVVAAQVERARRAFGEKMAGLSRDVAIKQAELEQSNLQQVVAEGVQLESKLMDNALQIEQQAFEAARAVADSNLPLRAIGIQSVTQVSACLQPLISCPPLTNCRLLVTPHKQRTLQPTMLTPPQAQSGAPYAQSLCCCVCPCHDVLWHHLGFQSVLQCSRHGKEAGRRGKKLFPEEVREGR